MFLSTLHKIGIPQTKKNNTLFYCALTKLLPLRINKNETKRKKIENGKENRKENEEEKRKEKEKEKKKVSFSHMTEQNLFLKTSKRFSGSFYGKRRSLILEETAYENNECVYLKNNKTIIIKKNKGNGNHALDQMSNGNDKKTQSENKSEQINDMLKKKGEEKQEIKKELHHKEHNIDNNDKTKIISSNIKDTVMNSNKFNNDHNVPTMKKGNDEVNLEKGNDEVHLEKGNDEVHLEKRNEALMKILTEEENHVMIRKEKRFCDFLWVTVKSGKGGSPNYKVQRSKKLKGEGYGGNGGNIFLKSKNSISDLIKIEQKIKGNDGEDFKENSRGKDGKDVIVYVPIGTIVRKRVYIKKKNINNRKIYKSIFWFQFLKEDEQLLVARGGKGGLSYSYFKKHDYRLPESGEKVHLELELRLMNDVAFIGIENSGKTSLCSSLTKYYGNITDSPFSTTIPHVSNINYIDGVQISLLDTPYLFFNAHKDKNRGRRILRHLFRSKLIVYVVDVSSSLLKNKDTSQPIEYFSEEQRGIEKEKEKEKEIHYKNAFDVCENNKENFTIKQNNHNINNNNKYTANDNTNIANTAFSTGAKNKQNQQQLEEVENEDINNFNNYYSDTVKQIKMLRNELYLYNNDFLKKKELVVATKCEMLHKNTLVNLDSLYYRLRNVFPHMEVIGTSAKFGLGIILLSRKIRELLYPQYVLQNEKLYAKNIEDYVIPTYAHFQKGRQKLQNYELPENIKHMYDINYLENFDFFLKGKKKEQSQIFDEKKQTETKEKYPSLIHSGVVISKNTTQKKGSS